MTADQYAALITAWHRSRPKFVATVRATVEPFADAQVVSAGLPAAFDIDTAIGAQLDIVGEWVGRTRVVPQPYLDTYFRLDDPARGLDVGVWRQPFDPDTILVTTDDTFFRRMLKAKVLINGWDGAPEATQAVLGGFFTDPETHTFVESAGDAVFAPTPFALDMPGAGLDEGFWRTSFFSLDRPGAGLDESRWRYPLEFDDVPDSLSIGVTIGVAGKTPSIAELAALAAGFVTTKAGGVPVTHRVASVNGAPLFGLDIDNDVIGGLDRGAWGVDPGALVALAA